MLPRSVYSRKLGEFPALVFADHAAFQFHGQWNTFFADRIGPAHDGRVICEIGCGDASFLNRIASKYPNTAFIGLDWKCKPIHDGARGITDARLNNIALLRGRGQDISRIFGRHEIDEIWLFHPDPVPPRLVDERFLLAVSDVLKIGTSLLAIKTDHPAYYQCLLGMFGLAEPTWFQLAREGKSNPPHPRVRRADLLPPGTSARPSATAQARFAAAMQSADFWNDPTTLTHVAGRCFAGETTAFEQRFISKRFPIYYVELRGLRDILR